MLSRNTLQSGPEATESLFQRLVDEAPVAIAVMNAEGKIEFINKKAVQTYGYEMKDLDIISDWWSMVKPRKISENDPVLKDAFLNDAIQQPQLNEYKVPCKNGELKIVNISEVRIDNKILVIIDDITERVESELHYRMISELTTDYLYKLKIDTNGQITVDYMSDNYHLITGRQKKEATIELWSGFIHPDDLPLVMNQLKEMIAAPCSKELQCRSFVHGNKQRWVNIVSRSEWDPDESRVTTIYGAVKDITERKHAEMEINSKNEEIEAQNREYLRLNAELMKINAELHKAKEKAEESDRLKTSFLQNMSHEIRTPMNAIMGFASLIPQNFSNQDKLEKFSVIINQRCEDLLEIINGILDIAKIESGQLMVNPEECNLVDLFSELTSFFREFQQKNGRDHIRFSMHVLLDPSQAILFTDKIKLKQIMINLISNAFKFTEHGNIEVGCKPDRSRGVIFYVTDTGIGIPHDKYELIFKRFSQIQDSRLKNYGGSGLGLSIVKGLVDLLGGTIWLESVPEEEGSNSGGHTTFYFTLPYAYQKPDDRT